VNHRVVNRGKDQRHFLRGERQAPALEWLLAQPEKVQDKFDFVIELLEENGSTLKRPYAAPLRDKIYELRVRWRRVNYRLLYFFHGSTAAVLAHGCTKEAQVDAADINRAVARKNEFAKDPKGHTHGE
jgi:hypothetical protein